MGIFDSSNMKKALNQSLSLEKRKKAVGKVNDQGLLAQIARNDTIAWNDTDSKVRREACKRLYDQELLARVARDASDTLVRIMAYGKLNSQELWAQLARDEPHAFMRQYACERLDDQALLAKIATDDKEETVRLAACEKLDDQALLAKIATTDPAPAVCLEAFSKAFDQLSDDHELCCKVVSYCIAQTEKFDRYGIVKKLDILVRIAAHDPGLIRQSWPQIKSACHTDNPKITHSDYNVYGSDCGTDTVLSHTDCRKCPPNHLDESNSHLLRDFPAAARS